MNLKVVANGFATVLAKRFLGPFWIRRRWLNQTQSLNEQKLSELQLRLLKRLLCHCYATVPYYRRLMDERGMKGEDVMSLKDIKIFPVITKQEVLKAGNTLVSTKYPKWLLRKATTGGTSGVPMQVYRDLFSIGNEHAFVRRQWDWAGIRFRDRCAYLTGRVIAKPDQTEQLCAYDPIMKELILSTYHLSPATAKSYARWVKEYKVKAIVGYPSAVHLLARTCLDSGIGIKLHAVLTTSETLVDSVRTTIRQAFDCEVFDFYGSAERVCYIHTCEHGNYHIIPEYGLTELIPIGDSTEMRHKVIATGFWNMAMPLVRYDTGDVVTKSDDSCACGRQFQLVKSIDGREGNEISTPSGRRLGTTLITHLIYVIRGAIDLVEVQIIQDALNHITIEYVPGQNFLRKNLKVIKALIAEHLPSELNVDLKQVKMVARTNSGKVRPFLSLLDSRGHHI